VPGPKRIWFVQNRFLRTLPISIDGETWWNVSQAKIDQRIESVVSRAVTISDTTTRIEQWTVWLHHRDGSQTVLGSGTKRWAESKAKIVRDALAEAIREFLGHGGTETEQQT
jgi:hypothetical protein